MNNHGIPDYHDGPAAMNPARDGRILAIAAIAFAITFFVNIVLTDAPDMYSANAPTLDFYRDSGLLLKGMLAAYAAAAAAFCFIVMVVSAVRLLDRSRQHFAAIAAAIGGVSFVALYLVGAALFVAPAFTLVFNNEAGPIPLTDDFALFARAAVGLGDVFLLFICGFSAAVFVAAVSFGGRRADFLPRWLAAFGVVTAVVLVLPLIFFSLIFLVGWAVVIGAYLLRRQSSVSPEPNATAPVNARASAEG